MASPRLNARPGQTAQREARTASSAEPPSAQQAGLPLARLPVMAGGAGDAIAAEDPAAGAIMRGEALRSVPSPVERQVPTSRTSDTSGFMTIVWPATESWIRDFTDKPVITQDCCKWFGDECGAWARHEAADRCPAHA